MDDNTIQEIFFIGKVVLTLIFISGAIYLPIHFLKKKSEYLKGCTAHKRNYILVISWLFTEIVIGVVLYSLWGMIKLESVAKVDLIIGIATILGIIGAAWAVFARVDAERAFEQAFKAREKAEETLNALGNSFLFHEILNPDKFSSIINNDSKPESHITLSLYLGFPCVGFLYNEKTKFKIPPAKVFHNLSEYLYKLNLLLSNEEIEGFTLNLYVFSKIASNNLLAKHDDKKIEYAGMDLINSFYDNVDKVKKHSKTDSKGKPLKDGKNNLIVIKDDFSMDEKFRFIGYYNSKAIPNSLSKRAFIWLVPKLQTDDGKTESFESAAFQTNDSNFISVMESVFV